MATIYKAKAVGGTETITARVYSNGEEIHSEHPLYPRTTYQWYLDRLNGMDHEEIAGATSNTYNVPLGDVSNSGEYYCKFTIGLTGCTVEYSPRTRISIVSCEGSTVTPNPIPWGGSSAVQVTILHAKFETAVFSNEGLSWATHISTTPCAACLSTTTTVATFSVAANSGQNKARRGQVSLAVGGIKCYYNLVQDYERTAVAIGTETDPDVAPFIELDNNGPATAGGNVNFQASVGVPGIDPNGTTGDYTITWSASGRGTVDEANRQAIYTKASAGSLTVTATVTDNNTLLTDTASTIVNFVAAPIPSEPSGVTGIIPSWVGTDISTHDFVGNVLPRTNSTSFEITGDGNFSLYTQILPAGFSFGGDFLGIPNSYATIVEVTLTGPGAANGKEVITLTATGPGLANRTNKFTGIGHYTVSMRWFSSIPAYPAPGSLATASVTVNVDGSGLFDDLLFEDFDWNNMDYSQFF